MGRKHSQFLLVLSVWCLVMGWEAVLLRLRRGPRRLGGLVIAARPSCAVALVVLAAPAVACPEEPLAATTEVVHGL